MSELSNRLRAYTDALERGDFDTMGIILDLACFDRELSNAIHHWHYEHDEPVILTDDDVSKINKIYQDILDTQFPGTN